jgi:hypothetical protein
MAGESANTKSDSGGGKVGKFHWPRATVFCIEGLPLISQVCIAFAQKPSPCDAPK